VATNARCSGEVVEKVAEYLVYWYRYKDRDDVPEMTMRPEICLEVLRAADYLGLDGRSSLVLGCCVGARPLMACRFLCPRSQPVNATSVSMMP
jgi:hypothetical protein